MSDPYVIVVLALASIALLVVSSHQLWSLIGVERTRRRAVHTDTSTFSAMTIAGAGVLCVTALAAPKMLFVIVPVAGVVFKATDSVRKQRKNRSYEHDLPEALEQIAGNVRAGANMMRSFEDAARDAPGEVGKDLRRLSRHVVNGMSMKDALGHWVNRRPLPSVRLTASSIDLALRTGMANAQALDGVVMSLRRNLNASRSAKTNASQSMASAWALTVMPVLFTGSMLVFDPQMRTFLFDTWAGIALLAAGLTLDGLGFLWMHRLVDRAVRL